MSYDEQSDKIAGTIGLLKQYVTRTGRETAEDATLLFGGRGITATGMGKFIENVSHGNPPSMTSVPRSAADLFQQPVPSNLTVRRHSGRIRGCARRPRGTAGNQEDAEQCSPLKIAL